MKPFNGLSSGGGGDAAASARHQPPPAQETFAIRDLIAAKLDTVGSWRRKKEATTAAAATTAQAQPLKQEEQEEAAEEEEEAETPLSPQAEQVEVMDLTNESDEEEEGEEEEEAEEEEAEEEEAMPPAPEKGDDDASAAAAAAAADREATPARWDTASVPGVVGIRFVLRLEAFGGHVYCVRISYGGNSGRELGCIYTLREAVDVYNTEAAKRGKALNVYRPEHERDAAIEATTERGAAIAATTAAPPPPPEKGTQQQTRKKRKKPPQPPPPLPSRRTKLPRVCNVEGHERDERGTAPPDTRPPTDTKPPVRYVAPTVRSPVSAGARAVPGLTGVYFTQETGKYHASVWYGCNANPIRHWFGPVDTLCEAVEMYNNEARRVGKALTILPPEHEHGNAPSPPAARKKRVAPAAAPAPLASSSPGKKPKPTKTAPAPPARGSGGRSGGGGGGGGAADGGRGTSVPVPPPPQRSPQQPQQQPQQQPPQQQPPQEPPQGGGGDANVQRMMDKIAALEQYSKALQSQNELLLSSAGALARQVAQG
jgi:hypothetical protein